MNKRQKETQQVFLDSEKAVLKRLEKVYRDALDEINNKIELLLARQDADMAHVIYQVQYQKALKDQVSAILEQLHNNEFETLSEYLAQSYEDGFLGTMYDLQGQGIPLVIPIDQEQIVAAIQHETKLSENLYTALGRDTKDLSKKIAGEISRGISRGMMYSEIARNIAAYGRIPKNNAMRIARTEAHRMQTKAAMDAQWKAKGRGADVVKQWDSTLDGRTRDSHRQVDGEIRELDEKFSNGLLYPGDPSGPASEVVNCRCALLQRAKWALDDSELNTLKERAEYFGLDKTKNFDEYKEKYLQASERVRKDVQKINDIEGLGNGNKTVYNSAKLEETTDKWSKEAKEELLLDERSLSVRKKETACVYSGDGKFLFQKRGEVSEVQFGIRDLFRLKGTVITHNHPTGGSFSDSDIYFLFFSKAAEIRVSTENCSYYIRQPEKWDKAIKSKEKIIKERNKIRDSVKEKYKQLYVKPQIISGDFRRLYKVEIPVTVCG